MVNVVIGGICKGETHLMNKHILAASAGFAIEDGIWRLGPIMRYGLRLTGKPSPRLCYLGTAGGDDATWTRAFYSACFGEDVTPSHLQLFTMPNVPDVRAHLLAQRTQRRDRIDLRIMSLLALQMTHLSNQRLRAAHLHAVDYVSDFHTYLAFTSSLSRLPSYIRLGIAV